MHALANAPTTCVHSKNSRIQASVIHAGCVCVCVCVWCVYMCVYMCVCVVCICVCVCTYVCVVCTYVCVVCTYVCVWVCVCVGVSPKVSRWSHVHQVARCARFQLLCGTAVESAAISRRHEAEVTLAGLEPAIFGSEDQRLIH